MNKKAKLGITIFFVILPLIFFYKIFSAKMIISGDFSGSDLVDLHYPFKEILHQSFSNGVIPLWEPKLAMGFPIFAEGQTGIFYPLNLILALLPSSWAINLNIIFIFVFTSLTTYWYLRLIGRSRSASIFGAIAFAFSAFFITRFKHLNMVNVASLFPILLCFTKRYFDTLKYIYLILSGLVIAGLVFAGHPQMAFYILIVFFLYTIFETIRSSKGEFSKKIPSVITFLFISALIGIGISAIQIIPTLELVGLSARSEFNFATLTAYPFHPLNLLTLIFPFYFGNPATGSYQPDISQFGIFWENASYIGLIPIVLALYSICRLIRNKKERTSYQLFFTLLALISLTLMLGKFTPLFLVLTKVIPLFALFRFPTRFNLFFIFSLVVLASYTFDQFKLKIPQDKRKTVTILIILITIADLFAFASKYISYLSIAKLNKIPDIVNDLKKDKDKYRIYSLTQYGQNPYGAIGWLNNIDSLLNIRETIPPNNNIFYNLDSFTDRGWFEGGLGLTRRQRLENYLLKDDTNWAVYGKILGIFNVKYLLSFQDQVGIEINKKTEYDLGKDFATKLKLFENDQVLPRLMYLPEAQVVDSEEKSFNLLTSLEFQPTKTVILEQAPNKPLGTFSGIVDDFKKDNPVEISSYKADEVVIKAKLKNPGYLVLSDINYPGWKATIDSKSAQILTANYLVRALEMNVGNHTVRFYYDPNSFKLGEIISLITFMTIIIITFFVIGNKRSSLKKQSVS